MENPTLGCGPLKVGKYVSCRLCMKTHEYYLNIFVSYEEFTVSVGKAIKDLLVLEVAKDDNLPEIVCCPCVTKLMEFRDFKEMCVNSAREFGRHTPVEPIMCPVKDEFLPMQLLGEGTSGTWSNSVDGESKVPVAPNDLSLHPFALENETDTKEVCPRDPLGEFYDSGEEDFAETEGNEDAAVCSESKQLFMGDQCPVKDEFLPLQLLGEGTSGMWSHSVEGESRVHVSRNDLLPDPLALENQTYTNEPYPKDPLGESDDCGEDNFAETECNVDAALFIESKQILMGDQGEVKKELELDEVVGNVESHSREIIDEGDSSDTGGPSLLSDNLAVTDMVDRCKNIEGQIEDPENESEIFGADRQGISQNEVLNSPSFDPVHEKNFLFEYFMANSFVVDCFSEGRVTRQEKNVKIYALSKKFSQLNDRARPIRSHKREQLCHQAQNTSFSKEYICNYCSARYSERKSLALHIEKHLDGTRSARVFPKTDFPSRFSKNLLVKELGNVERDMHERSSRYFTQKRSRRKNEIPNFDESSRGDKLGKELNENRKLLFHSVKSRKKAAFECDTCGIAFLKKGDLVKHINVHTGLNPLHCRFCVGKLISKDMLNGHQVMHTVVERLKCNLCGKLFSAYRDQQKRAVTHTNLKPLKCDLCGKNFKNTKTLKRHSLIHTSVKPIKCNECGKMFFTKGDLIRHLVVHTSVKRFKCNECGKIFARIGDLKAHSVVHTGVKAFKCNECGKMFSRRRYLTTHSVVHTGEKAFKCNDCEKMFSTSRGLNQHLFVHTGVRPFKCNECGKMFITKSDLKRHSVVHTGVKPFKCNECGKMFSTKSVLKMHSVVHTGVKPFKCNECGKMFTKKSDLIRHSVVHTGVKPFKCNECGKMFSSKSVLKMHSVVHTGVKKFKCKRCGKIFSTSSSFYQHSFVHTGLKLFKCNECDKIFTRSGHLRIHSRVHTGVKPFKCDECGMMFSQRSNLRSHSRIHSGVNPFKCDFCGEQFKWRTGLNRHLHTHADQNTPK